MNGIRFEALVKTWTSGANRRRALAGMLGGALGALGRGHAEDADAAKSGKCTPKCGPCNVCKQGKCKKKNGEKRCKKGRCKPEERGTPCVGGPGNCACVRAIEGDAFCAAQAIVECSAACASSGECAAGRRCVECGSGGKTACFPECGSV